MLDVNRRVILDYLIGINAPRNIATTCADTGLSRPTVTSALQTLVDSGLVEKIVARTPRPRGGRRGNEYQLALASHGLIAAVVNRHSISVNRVDLSGTVVAHREAQFDNVNQLDDPVAAICDQLAPLITEESDLHLHAIVIGVIGIVRDQRWISLSRALSRLQGDALHKQLTARFGLPVFIENDANLATYGEASLLDKSPIMISLLVGPDLGCGLLLDGALYRGAHGAAGELHSPEWEWAVQVMQDAERQYGSTFTLFSRAEAGDLAACELVDALIAQVATGLAAIVELLDVPHIVIGGDAVLAPTTFLYPLKVALSELLGWEANVTAASSVNHSVLDGAKALGIDQVFHHLYAPEPRIAPESE